MIHFALIGAGKMGRRWAGIFKGHTTASLNFVVSKNLTSAQNVASEIPSCTATTDLGEVLQNTDIDAVLITTPHTFLSPITHAALQSGKHVLCEKPGALASADIKKNMLLAQKNKLAYMISYNHRFHDAFMKTQKLYRQGVIGDIINIRARYGFGGRTGYDTEWRLDKKVSGGGHLLDQGVHMIDLALYFIGSPQKVCGMLGDTFWKKGVEDNAFVLIKGKNNAIASIHSSLTQWKPLHNFELYGTKGFISIEGLGRKYGGSEKLIIGTRAKNFSDSPREKVVICNPEADNSLKFVLKEFISALSAKRKPIPNAKDAYETLRVVEEVYKSNKLS